MRELVTTIALASSAEQRMHVPPEVLDDDAHLLRDRGRVEPCVADDVRDRLASVDLDLALGLVALQRVLHSEEHVVGRVVGEHVEDEALLDRLAPSCTCRRPPSGPRAGAEQAQRLSPSASRSSATKVMLLDAAMAESLASQQVVGADVVLVGIDLDVDEQLLELLAPRSPTATSAPRRR